MTNMPRCKTCKWWDQTGYRHHYGESQAEGYCRDGTDGMLLLIHGDADVGIATKPDFGCVMHEERSE